MTTEKPYDKEDVLLEKCKDLIRSRLGWEQSDSWTNQDFQMLAEKIQQITSVSLSVATLKRIWGKVKYDSKPTITTLNTLAQFLGYENWRSFKQAHQEVTGNGHSNTQDTTSNHTETAIVHEPRPVRVKTRWRSGLIGVTLCGSVLVIFLFAARKEKPVPSPDQYSFTSKKVVSEGIPNSVIFDYDASAAPYDSVFIQQSWDERLRKQVPRDGHQHTSIYYTPGFFQAKLVIGKQIVKEHNLWIKSQGWMTLVAQDPVPVYFKEEDYKKAGVLSLPIEKLKLSNIPFQPQLPWTSYYNVRDFGDIRTDNFVFEAEVRSDYKEGSGVCQTAHILLLLEGSIIMIPLSIKGCVSDLYMAFDDQGLDGAKTDLSAFGCDVSKWVKVRCEAKDKKARILINDNVAYESEVKIPRRIVGMIFRFQGTGSINSVKLSTAEGKYLFEDTF